MLEEIRYEEMNMFKVNPTTSDKEDQFSFRPVTNKENHQIYFKSNQRTTRLFCQLHDEFDIHDTEECPLNLNIKKEQTEHTRLNQSKKVTRAYCVNCELFTHWTYDCPLEKEKELKN